jgi:RNA polymerase sigma factor for flagellar operon FliA
VGTDEELVREYDALVRGRARNIARELNLMHALDDLVAYGFAGLLEAKGRFDPTEGTPFHGFAYRRVGGAIREGAEKFQGVSRRMWAKVEDAADAIAELKGAEMQALGEEHTLRELTDGLDSVFGQVIGTMIVGQLAEEQRTPETALMSELQRVRVREAIGQLRRKPREVIEAIYFSDTRYDDIGAKLGIKKSAVAIRHRKAIEALRELLSEPS